MKALRIAAWCASLGLGTYLRMSGVGAMLVGGEVAATGPDAAFHARRMLQAWAAFPAVPVVDRLLDWPHGAVAPWPPGFDLLAALCAQGTVDRSVALVIFAGLPVVLGLVLVAGTAWILRALLPEAPWWGSWVAGFVVAVVPQAVSVARFGNTDHHVAESLSMLGMGGWSLWACASACDRSLGWGRRIAIEAVGAALSFAALAVFVGAVAYVAIAALALTLLNAWAWRSESTLSASTAAERLTPTFRRSPRGAAMGMGAPGLFVGAMLVALLYGPLVAAHGRSFDYAYPSWLQPLLVALAAVGCGAGSLVGWMWAGGGRRVRACALALLAGLALLVLAAPVLRELPAVGALWHGVREWFGGEAPLLVGGTSESQPMFSGRRFWEFGFWARCHQYYGVFGLLAPLSYLIAARACAERARPPVAAAFWVWTFCITACAIHQNRFGRVALVNLAVCTGVALVYLGWRWASLQRIAPLVVLAAFSFDPIFHYYLRRSTALALPPEQESAAFLRRHARAAIPGNRAGVLTSWDQSHYVVRYGERPVTATGFGFYIGDGTFAETERLWLGDERALSSFMQRHDLGYVMQSSANYEAKLLHGRGPWLESGVNTEYLRALPLSTLLVGGGGVADLKLPHLQHLLPLHASSWAAGPHVPFPASWVYERVAGARWVGAAAPGSLVRLQLGVRLRGAPMRHEAWTTTDASGHFELVTPLPTSYRGDGFETAERAELRVGDEAPRPARIREAAVRSGGSIEVDRAAQDLIASSPP